MSDAPATVSYPTVFTKEEGDAMRATKHLLLTKFKLTEDKISNLILAITTMNCKCQPAIAAEKYAKWLKLIDDGMGIKTYDEVLNEVGLKGEKLIGSTYAAGLASVYYSKMTENDISFG